MIAPRALTSVLQTIKYLLQERFIIFKSPKGSETSRYIRGGDALIPNNKHFHVTSITKSLQSEFLFNIILMFNLFDEECSHDN